MSDELVNQILQTTKIELQRKQAHEGVWKRYYTIDSGNELETALKYTRSITTTFHYRIARVEVLATNEQQIELDNAELRLLDGLARGDITYQATTNVVSHRTERWIEEPLNRYSHEFNADNYKERVFGPSKRLIELGLVSQSYGSDPSVLYTITEKGRWYVKPDVRDFLFELLTK
ncbi:MAG: hypothetical protein J0M07_07030 [Anaerolineae bacterium]|nr:hypothetical protein [Anaerolineae bacterium]